MSRREGNISLKYLGTTVHPSAVGKVGATLTADAHV